MQVEIYFLLVVFEDMVTVNKNCCFVVDTYHQLVKLGNKLQQNVIRAQCSEVVHPKSLSASCWPFFYRIGKTRLASPICSDRACTFPCLAELVKNVR